MRSQDWDVRVVDRTAGAALLEFLDGVGVGADSGCRRGVANLR
jgi:hypothetical protein